MNELDGTSELKNSRKRNAIIPEGVTIMSRNKKPRVSLNERISSILGDPIDESETSQEISDESIQEISSNIESSENENLIEVPKLPFIFQCNRCSVRFDNIDAKDQHMKMGLGKLKLYKCPKCEFRSCHYDGAKEHYVQNHMKNQYDEYQHENIQNVTMYRCGRCSMTFDNLEEKNQHMNLVLGKSKQFACLKCPFRSCHLNGATEHYIKMHGFPKTNESVLISEIEIEKTSDHLKEQNESVRETSNSDQESIIDDIINWLHVSLDGHVDEIEVINKNSPNSPLTMRKKNDDVSEKLKYIDV